MMRLRTALPEDAAQLLDLIRQHADFEQAKASLTQADLVAILEAKSPPTCLVVAEEENSLIGYAAFTIDYALWTASRFMHLDCLFLRESARGQGIGKRLIEYVSQLAGEAGVGRMEWQTPVWNLDAIRFYQREGGIAQPKMRFTRQLYSPSFAR